MVLGLRRENFQDNRTRDESKLVKVSLDNKLRNTRMSGQGSSGNVISAIASFIYPGLGQLCQGRIMAAAIFFFTATVLWFVLLGWIMHIWSTVDAARYRSPYCD